MNITNDSHHFRFFFGPVNNKCFIPIRLSKKPQHKDYDSLSFVLEITNNYIHWKNNILIDNLAKANVQLWRSRNELLKKISAVGHVIFFSVFLSQNHITWKEICH